jgi:hypothetical protein
MGTPGSADISIGAVDNLVMFRTPLYQGSTFTSEYLSNRFGIFAEALEEKADRPTIGENLLITDTRGDLRLGNTAARWNDIGDYDRNMTVLSVIATVATGTGTFATVNATDDLRVRLVNGNIEEWHSSPTMGSKPLFLEIKGIQP